jgi:hypothetical protein
LTIVVLLILAILWAAVLVPPALRARAESSPVDSIGSFRRQLRILQRVAPGVTSPVRPSPALQSPPVMVMGTVRSATASARRAQSRVQKRRRDILFGLLAAMGGSLLLGFVPPLRVMWGLHVALDVVFVAYVALLVHLRNLALEQEMKVRFLPPSPPPEPALLLRRTGN